MQFVITVTLATEYRATPEPLRSYENRVKLACEVMRAFGVAFPHKRLPNYIAQAVEKSRQRLFITARPGKRLSQLVNYTDALTESLEIRAAVKGGEECGGDKPENCRGCT